MMAVFPPYEMDLRLRVNIEIKEQYCTGVAAGLGKLCPGG